MANRPFLKSLTIQGQLALLISSFLAAMLIVTLTGFYLSNVRKDTLNFIHYNLMPSIDSLRDMKDAYANLQLNEIEISIYETNYEADAQFKATLQKRNRAWSSFDSGLETFQSLAPNVVAGTNWNKFLKAHHEFSAQEKELSEIIKALSQTRNQPEIQKTLFRKFYRDYFSMRDSISSAIDLLDELIGQTNQTLQMYLRSAEENAATIRSTFYFVAGFAAIFSVLMGILIYRSVLSTLIAQKQAQEELRRSAERLEIAQQSAHAGVWDFDLVTQEVIWSPQLFKLYGLDPEKTAPSLELWKDTLFPEDREPLIRSLEQTLIRGTMVPMEYRVIHANGETRWLSSWGSTTFGPDKKPLRISGICLDITEKRLLEERLRSAIEARDDFISIASHELKTPLSGLQMQLQLLARVVNQAGPSSDSRIHTLCSGALRSVFSLSKLLDELLDLTRIRGGQLSLNIQKMDLRENIQESIQQLEEEAKRKGNSITLLGQESVEGNWDPTRLHQVFTNLLSNAIKYGDSKPIEIQISSDNNRGIAQVQVVDQGIGMTPEIQKKIFHRFQRGVTGESIKGLGLGLYITREIVEAHRGSIQVKSHPKQGSVFTVELPLEADSREKNPAS